MTTVEVLQKARALVEKGWTQGHYARHWTGLPVSPSGHWASRWCMAGALKACGTEPQGTASRILSNIVRNSYISWQDAPGRTQAEVLSAFDRAISLASGEPAAGPSAPSEEK